MRYWIHFIKVFETYLAALTPFMLPKLTIVIWLI